MVRPAVLYSPGTFAWNVSRVMVPGTASCFTRKFGRYMEWITSVEASWTTTGAPTGTRMSSVVMTSSGVPNLPSAPG